MIQLVEPYTEEKIRALKMGEIVHLSGVIYTGRDAVHKFLHDGASRRSAWRNKSSTTAGRS